MKIILDGKKIECEGKKTVLEVARENGTYIPSLCDHFQLAPFTGCRLCLVEIKGRKGYSPSCGTYVEEGMEVKTKTPALQRLRKQILELILSEHPNACLVCREKKDCDEYKSTIRKVGEVTGCVLCANNGRCELQEVVEALKIDRVRFPSLYRDFEVKKADPFFDRNHNLCILCGRCVRVCHEIRGASVLSFIYRGSQAVVGTALDRSLLESECQFCGACVDVCPTGALTERAIKYELLPEEKARTICPLCSMGCELEIELKEGRILSSRPSREGPVNQGQACVKGRFAIRDLVYSSRRILRPMIRERGGLREASWTEALDFVAGKLKKFKGNEIALVGSSQVSCEDSFIFQKFARQALKTKNIDSAAQFSPLAAYLETARKNGLKTDLNVKFEDLSRSKVLFLTGSDIAISQPIVWVNVLKAVRAGAELIVASPVDSFLKRFSSVWLHVEPGAEFHLLALLSRVLLEGGKGESFARTEGFGSFKKSLEKVSLLKKKELTGISEEELKKASQLLLKRGQTTFLFGAELTQSPQGSQNIGALWNLACLSQARLFPLGLEGNLRGQFEVGQGFPGKGLAFHQIIKAASSGDIKALYLAGSIPPLKKSALEFVVLQDAFMHENMDYADAVLPAATSLEAEGTFINNEGRFQRFDKSIHPLGEAKPDWWIISQIAQRMGKKGFHFTSSRDVMKEMSQAVQNFSGLSPAKLSRSREIFARQEQNGKRKFIPLDYSRSSHHPSKKYPLFLFFHYNLDYYRNLSLPREIESLRKIRDSRWITLSPEDAENLKLHEGEEVVIESSSGKGKGLIKISESMPRGITGASFLWNEELDFSGSNLVFPSSGGSHFLRWLRVKIYRGK